MKAPTTEWCVSQLRIAYCLATRSPDTSTQNGAIVYDSDLRILGMGVNDFTKNMPISPDIMERPKKYAFIEHAERNAIFDVFKSGYQPHVMVAAWAACTDCARAIVQSGIRILVRHERIDTTGRWGESIKWADDILRFGGVEVIDIKGEIGECGPVLFDGKLYYP